MRPPHASAQPSAVAAIARMFQPAYDAVAQIQVLETQLAAANDPIVRNQHAGDRAESA